MPKSTRGLKIDYPELAEYEELNMLRRAELWFVWFYACKTSPYYNLEIPEDKIVKKCLDAARMRFDDEAKEARWIARDFPEKISAAIKVMRNFEPSVRILAKLEAIHDLDQMRKLTSLELDEQGNNPMFLGKDGEVNFMSRKHYMDSISNKQSKIGSMIEKAEQGYGISIIDKESNKNLDDNGLTFLESWHTNT